MTSDLGMDAIPAREFVESDGVDDWRPIWGAAWACAYFVTGSFAQGAAFVARIVDLAAAAGHEPDVDLRREGVFVRLITGEWGGLARRDVALARQISVAARELHIEADPTRVQFVQVSIDATDAARCLPFWSAVLGYELVGDEDAFDRLRHGPVITFQQMDVPRTQRNRIHLDLYVPHDQAQVRIDAALAAGGQMVNDSNAPHWWTLADPEGNEVDIAIWGIY